MNDKRLRHHFFAAWNERSVRVVGLIPLAEAFFLKVFRDYACVSRYR